MTCPVKRNGGVYKRDCHKDPVLHFQSSKPIKASRHCPSNAEDSSNHSRRNPF